MDSRPIACILAGGLGTRLRHLYPDRPKALVPFRGRPFIEWQIGWLLHHGIQRIHICAGHLGEQLVNWAASSPVAQKAKITVSVEPEPLGTAGGLAYAVEKELQPSGRLVVVNGDTLLPRADLRRFISSAASPGASLIAVVEVPDAARFGTVEIDAKNCVIGFREKGSTGPGWVNAGVYLLDESVIEQIPRAGACSLEKNIFPQLAQSRRLYAWVSPPPLIDIGTPSGLSHGEALIKDFIFSPPRNSKPSGHPPP